MEFHVIIPARYESTRFSGKVLSKVKGKYLLQHAYDNAVASGAESVVIATDDERVEQIAIEFGAKVCMTAMAHQSGTERIAEVVSALEYDENEIIVALQADYACLPADTIRQVAYDLAEHDNVKVVSLCEAIKDPNMLFNPNIVKVVFNRRAYAMYFSRAPIPWEKNNFNDPSKVDMKGEHYRHIGIYAYRASFLQNYLDWPSSPLESLECLEQLRILWNGTRIHMSVSKGPMPPAVHTEEDIKKVLEYLGK
jgi:3-deoxy-manno-octulosonate cytidylyltransferase (CMP-KDO synthetase)